MSAAALSATAFSDACVAAAPLLDQHDHGGEHREDGDAAGGRAGEAAAELQRLVARDAGDGGVRILDGA